MNRAELCFVIIGCLMAITLYFMPETLVWLNGFF